MKYWTKEWYDLSQRMSLHTSLKVRAFAEQYDETIYIKKYQKKLNKHLSFQEETYNIRPFSPFFSDKSDYIPLESIFDLSHIPEEHKITIYPTEKDKSDYEASMLAFNSRPPFDVELETETFSSIQQGQINYMKAILPEHIQAQIADISLFALGYCSKDVYKRVKAYSKHNKTFIDTVREQAIVDLRSQPIADSIREAINFHDCQIIDIHRAPNFELVFDNRGGFTSNDSITFIDTEIVLEEDGLLDSTWIYEELYKIEDGYELHVLLYHGKLVELILRCKDIVVKEGDKIKL